MAAGIVLIFVGLAITLRTVRGDLPRYVLRRLDVHEPQAVDEDTSKRHPLEPLPDEPSFRTPLFPIPLPPKPGSKVQV